MITVEKRVDSNNSQRAGHDGALPAHPASISDIQFPLSRYTYTVVTFNTDTGLLHFLVCRRIPTPQDREHSLSSLQALQPPCTGLNGGRWLGITNFSSSMGTHFPSRHHWKRRKWKRYERNLEDTRNWIVRSLKPQSSISDPLQAPYFWFTRFTLTVWGCFAPACHLGLSFNNQISSRYKPVTDCRKNYFLLVMTSNTSYREHRSKILGYSTSWRLFNIRVISDRKYGEAIQLWVGLITMLCLEM